MSAELSTPSVMNWHISRTCESGACVKVARDGDVILVGNTNQSEGPVSKFTREEWREFLAGVKLGDFDDLV